MKIATIGRGNVGGGLAKRWREAGNDVTEIGSDGGDVSDADVVLLAVPGRAIEDALRSVTGIEGKVVVDATNLVSGHDDRYESNAHHVKAITGGPTAKAFNLNFARAYDRIDGQDPPPGNLFAADDEAREVVEQLCRDAGYEPVYAGGLESAAAREGFLAPLFAISQDRGDAVFYRVSTP